MRIAYIVLLGWSCLALNAQAQVVATPDAGTADAGIASRPIANVAANDSINGVAVTLGATGNGSVAQWGAWPDGIALTPSTGAVSTTIAVTPGIYTIPYQLCDKSSPPNCATTNDTVTVLQTSISAVPDSGTADAGIASRPIANVAANDTVNGAPATLGPTGNASVMAVGTWPNGIALTPSTGAISTKVSVPAGPYTMTYQLCDHNTPVNCATATDTVNVINASINAVPDSGVADAGIGSRPISNVVANDSINGAPVTLGSGGNGVIAMVGSWPSGIVLNTTTGAISTSVSLAQGAYGVTYSLCDHNSPANCATANDTVTVIAASIVATPDSATVNAGLASTAVASVTANDTVDGSPATLGSGGNATITAYGAWPSGITLNTSSGAIKVASTVPPNAYSVGYQLCDHNSPANCAVATDSINVRAVIVAAPVAGSAFQGQGGIAIGNLVVKDSVNSALAVLGSSGNATLSPVGSWPAGFTLDPNAGTISVASSVATGNYALPVQLCDLNTPANCAVATNNVTVNPPSVETMASSVVLGDIEFDAGRDGVPCPQCNDGQGIDRLNWTDRLNNLWVSPVDRTTGLFVPNSGQQTLVDNSAAFWSDFGNGPEWTYATPPGSTLPASQLVYTRYQPGQPYTYFHAGAAFATASNGVWTPQFFPGSITAGHNSILPEPTQCNTDPVAWALYADNNNPTQAFTEPLSVAAGTAPTLTSFGAYFNQIGTRWVACTHWLTFQGTVQVGSNTLQQVFWYNADTQALQQLTFDTTNKQRALMFKAPELLGTAYPYMLIVLAADTQIQIYQQTGVASNGGPIMTLYNTIYSPDPTEPYFFAPKGMVQCNPGCKTYVAAGLSKQPNAQFSENIPTGLAMMNIDPVNPYFRVLVPASSKPLVQRLDPEYYITDNGPYLYYDYLLAQTKTQPYQDIGVFFVDMGLGPISGPCVGSSAEGGLAGPVGQCQ